MLYKGNFSGSDDRRGAMTKSNHTRLMGVIFLVLAAFLLNGCAGGGETMVETGGQTLPQEVTTEYLLTTAGFKRLVVTNETPRSAALLNNIPPGQLVVYRRDGEVYHAYADVGRQTLYIGDLAAYQRYETLAKGKNLCVRVPGTNPVQFWGCMQEYQGRGASK
jgi:hypothetical protein